MCACPVMNRIDCFSRASVCYSLFEAFTYVIDNGAGFVKQEDIQPQPVQHLPVKVLPGFRTTASFPRTETGLPGTDRYSALTTIVLSRSGYSRSGHSFRDLLPLLLLNARNSRVSPADDAGRASADR